VKGLLTAILLQSQETGSSPASTNLSCLRKFSVVPLMLVEVLLSFATLRSLAAKEGPDVGILANFSTNNGL
jgi:hypothetical protein